VLADSTSTLTAIMHEETIRQLLDRLKAGEIDTATALAQLKHLPYEDLGFARVDHHRRLRRGHPETILAAGKTPEQVRSIAERLLVHNANILVTRAEAAVYQACRQLDPAPEYHAAARMLVFRRQTVESTRTGILVMSAGTADIPVCEEAAITAELMGNRVARLYDVGVAGIHRLLGNRDKIEAASVLVVVAGMDGALPSVVGGLTDKPVIAVPTSVGYGANFGGLSALLTMLNSCACGVTVVNIDNGYGAGYAASIINHLADQAVPASARVSEFG
jgi:pyridinium-3,5-biscarboxylic acid mononucleotide synthase